MDDNLNRYDSAEKLFAGDELLCTQLQFFTPPNHDARFIHPKIGDNFSVRYSDDSRNYNLCTINGIKDMSIGIPESFWERPV